MFLSLCVVYELAAGLLELSEKIAADLQLWWVAVQQEFLFELNLQYVGWANKELVISLHPMQYV